MRRVRLRLAGAVLLTTLLLSVAEAAWAAACDPAMADKQPSDMGEMAGMDGMAASPAGHDCAQGSGHEHDPIRDGTGAECPFAPAGGLGCAVSASLPAIATSMHEPSPVSVLRHGATAVIAYHLRAYAIFHPPKA